MNIVVRIARQLRVLAIAVSLVTVSTASAGNLTGDEPVVMSVTVTVLKGMSGKFQGLPSVHSESTSLRSCFQTNRYYLNSAYLSWALSPHVESISVYCIYKKTDGTLAEYVAGIWTADGRYEPTSLLDKMKYPDWAP